MKECYYCHKVLVTRTKTCPECNTSGSLQTLPSKDPYVDYRDHFSTHFNGRPLPTCKYCVAQGINP